MDKVAWQATVHGINKELDRVEQLSTHTGMGRVRGREGKKAKNPNDCRQAIISVISYVFFRQ